jgi:Zn-dependent M28 family amino/carboxypeptidase
MGVNGDMQENSTRIRICIWPVLILLLFFQRGPDAIPQSQKIEARQLLEDLRILSADDMEGRKPGTRGSARARDYIVRRFKESGIRPFGDSYLRSFQFSFRNQTAALDGFNVVGHVRGKRDPDRFLVITAHYDHVGIEGGVVYNGADDNASGVAGLFAIAAHFAKNPPDHSILFAALDAEESGGFGARDLLRSSPVPKEAIVMNVNLDMICRDRNNVLFAAGTYHYPFLRPYLEKIIPRSSVKLLFGHDSPDLSDFEDWTDDSDHIWFHREKIPFIYFGVEDYEHHHKPTDDYENITPAFYVAAVDTIIDAVREFDQHLVEIARRSQ